jgi:hypothetical protein
MIELTELIWETEIGGLVVGVDESRCVVLRWEYPQHTVSNVSALIEALQEARRHVAYDAYGTDPCICAGLQEQAEAEQAKFEAEETARHEEWLALRNPAYDGEMGVFDGYGDEWLAEGRG